MKSRMVPAVFRRKSERKPGNSVSQKTISNTVVLYKYYLDEANHLVVEQDIGKFLESGMDVSPAELNEFHTFHTFISSHVQPNNMGDTPCMLLWAEWVRFCLKEMHTFPSAILEKEFRDLVINLFGFTIMEDEVRGQVYLGVRFVGKKNIPMNAIDRESAMV